jgi:hypothetical protein
VLVVPDVVDVPIAPVVEAAAAEAAAAAAALIAFERSLANPAATAEAAGG